MACTSGSDYRATPEEELAAIEHELNQVSSEIENLRNRQQYLLQRKQGIKDRLQSMKSQRIASKDWSGSDFPWSDRLNCALKTVFKIDSFRSNQLSAMNAILSKEDTILLMPTGGGKSLCYQLPSLVVDGFILVVCPLVALMEDQIMNLRKVGVSAYMLSQSTPKDEMKLAMTAMIDKKAPMKLLYVTPERMSKSKTFMNKLQQAHEMGRLVCIAIDEVHCCSQWGHDFRPDYKYLGVLKNMFRGVPLLGLTATATTKILLDVQKILQIQGCLILKATFNRPNLYYEVRPKPTKHEDFIGEVEDLLKHKYAGKTGIIYSTTIKDTEETCEQLRSRGIRAACYHANLTSEMRSRAHSGWLNGKYQVVVATIAFGLGINKPDVRFVLHQSLSKSMENFYQESGRAGRDGLPADCIVFYRLPDVFKVSITVFSQHTGLENLYSMVDYCLNVDSCRRSLLASHFDEVWDSTECNKMCDHCRCPYSVKTVDIKHHCVSLYEIIDHAAKKDTKLTSQKLIDAWFKTGPTNLRVTSLKCPSFLSSKSDATSKAKACSKGEAIIAFLLVNSYLREDFHYTAYSTISYIKKGPRSAEALSRNSTIEMFVKEAKLKTLSNNEVDQTLKSNQLNGRKASSTSSESTCMEKKRELVEPTDCISISDSDSDSEKNISQRKSKSLHAGKDSLSPKKKRVKVIDSDSSDC